jgi:N-acetylmuramic acid 6-phosphate etherase
MVKAADRSTAAAADTRAMDTERSCPRFSGIDTWEPQDALDAMIEAQLAAVAAVRAVRGAIADAVAAMEVRFGENGGGRGRLVYAGAGTSGRLAVQDGAELMPTFNWPPERLLLLIAGGREALLEAVEGAEDEMAEAAELVERHRLGPSDTLIAVAASGTTPFTLACLRAARQRGALTVGIANNRGTPILTEAHHAIFLDTGAEPIAGSTRMNAGTAQRIALNLISSLLMIRLGRVYKGLMVDVQASNAKLARRREAIVRGLTGRSRIEIRNALAHAGGSVKLAVLLLEGSDLELAREMLERAGGRLGAAIALLQQEAVAKPCATATSGRS